MEVWIDPDLCTGDGICAEIAPAVFFMDDDGLAYVKEENETGLGPDGKPRHVGLTGIVPFPEKLTDEVVEAAEECPGECIFIEP